jgi:uncharacterized protein (DUF885 family)
MKLLLFIIFLTYWGNMSLKHAQNDLNNMHPEIQLWTMINQHKDYIFQEYITHARADIGVSSLPDGHTYYQRCLDFHTGFLGITPEEIHQIGLEEIASLRKGVLKVAERVGETNTTFSEFTKKGDNCNVFVFIHMLSNECINCSSQ